MPVSVEDVVEVAAAGVLRALDARKKAAERGPVECTETAGLVRSGFYVSVVIRAGGFAGPLDQVTLNPQPLPPREE
jgi:hypothetical protein